jgi:RNA polymerase subunit RPABC4/transcription elongation factor Spt4
MTEVLVGGSLVSTLKLVGIVAIAYILVLWLSAVVWTYRDVKTRTLDPVSQSVATLLVGLFNLPGLIVYLVIRPHETIADSYERSLEAEAMLHELQLDTNACQNCRRPIEPDFNICPHCGVLLREACKNCNKLIRTNWAGCAYCGVERAPPRPAVPLAPEAVNTPPLRPPARQASTPAAGQTATASPAASAAQRRPVQKM